MLLIAYACARIHRKYTCDSESRVHVLSMIFGFMIQSNLILLLHGVPNWLKRIHGTRAEMRMSVVDGGRINGCFLAIFIAHSYAPILKQK